MSSPEETDPFNDQLFPLDTSTPATNRLDTQPVPNAQPDPDAPEGVFTQVNDIVVNDKLIEEQKKTNKCYILFTNEDVKAGLASKADIPTKPPSRGQLSDFMFSNVVRSNNNADKDQVIYYWQTVSALVYGILLVCICVPMTIYYDDFKSVAMIGSLCGIGLSGLSCYNIYTMVEANQNSKNVKTRYPELTQVSQIVLSGVTILFTVIVIGIILKKHKRFLSNGYKILTPLMFFTSFGVLIIAIHYLFKVLKYPNKRVDYKELDIHKLSSDTYEFTNRNRFKIVVTLKNTAPVPKVEQMFRVSPGEHVQFIKGGSFTLETYNGNEVYVYSSLNTDVPRSVNSINKMTLKL